MESAVSLGPSGSHLTSRDMWYSRQMWKAWRASSRISDFLLPLRRMDSTFWLSEYQRTSKGFQSETGSFKLSPGQTLNTFCQGPILIKCQNRNQTVGTTGWTGSIGKSYLDRKRLTSPINFAVEGMYIIHPKLDLWNGISDKRTSLSQERAEFTTEKKISGHNVDNWPHAAGKRNNRACYTSDSFNVNVAGRWRRWQCPEISSQFNNTIIGSFNRTINGVENNS